MEDEKDPKEITNCLACLGTGVVYNETIDDEVTCIHCMGEGEVTREANESFLESINYN